jgi:hypothetical protein
MPKNLVKLLNRDQAEQVALLAANYANYRLAVSNADEYFIVFHGERVLTATALLGVTESTVLRVNDVRVAVKAAQERLDRFEYEASRT